mgnify:CR=1 FL=1
MGTCSAAKIDKHCIDFLPLELGSLLNINDILLTLINFVILFIFCEKYLLGNKIQHSIIVLISLLLIPLINVKFFANNNSDWRCVFRRICRYS